MRRLLTLAVVVLATMALAVPAQATSQYRLGLSGANEVGGGDPDGSGTATVALGQDGTVCFDIRTSNVDDILAAHIHEAPAGVNGGVVVNLDIANVGFRGCVAGDPEVVAAIRANPSGYYVNVHSVEYPAGAVRGQLA